MSSWYAVPRYLDNSLKAWLVDGEVVGVPCFYAAGIDIDDVDLNAWDLVGNDGAGRSPLGNA